MCARGSARHERIHVSPGFGVGALRIASPPDARSQPISDSYLASINPAKRSTIQSNQTSNAEINGTNQLQLIEAPRKPQPNANSTSLKMFERCLDN